MDTRLGKLAGPLLVAVIAVSACAGPEPVSERVASAPTAAPLETSASSVPSPVTEQLNSAADAPFDARFFDTSLGIGQSGLLFFPELYVGVDELAAASDIVFVGTLVASSADLAEERLVTDPAIDDNSTVVYDGLEFRIDQLISGVADGKTVTIGHPVFIRYEEGLARINVDPIELLRPELEAKEASHQWLVFARTDDQTGLLTIGDGRLIRLDPSGLVADGASGEFEHRLPGTAYETSVDDIDALINRGVPLPRPRAPDMTREELLEAGVPQGGIRIEENLHEPDSPCYGLDDPQRLNELIKEDAC